MILKLLNWIASFRPVRRIEDEHGDLYLLRIKLWGWMPGTTKHHRWSGYLHHFMRPDQDRALHNHPWKWSFSIILAGGYVEERQMEDGRIDTRYLRPGTINILGPENFHRITELHGKETWTLFIAGPKYKSWGFLDAERGFVGYRDRFAERGIILPAGT